MTNRLPVSAFWGEDGLVVDPDTITPDKYFLGWYAEQFPAEAHNFYYNKQDKIQAEVLANHNLWKAEVHYQEGAIAFYNGVPYTASARSLGLTPPDNPSVWKSGSLVGLTIDELEVLLNQISTLLASHLAIDNPHGDTNVGVGAPLTTEVDADPLWSMLQTHLQDVDPHSLTAAQVNTLAALTGGRFNGAVRVNRGEHGDNSIAAAHKEILLQTLITIFGVKNGKVIAGNSIVTTVENMPSVRGESSEVFLIPQPLLHIPLATGVHSYTDIPSDELGVVTFTRPSTLQYTSKGEGTLTAEVDEPAIEAMGLKITPDSTLLPHSNLADGTGTVTAEVDGTVVALKNVEITSSTNLLSLFTGGTVRDIRVWGVVLSDDTIGSIGNGAGIPPAKVTAFTGVQIGQAIITPESAWTDEQGNAVYDLLDVNTAYQPEDYPLYTALRGTQLVYSGNNFDVSMVNIQPYAIDFDGTHFWLTGFSEEEPKVWQFDSSGNYTGFSFDCSSSTHPIPFNRIFGLTAQGAFLWIQAFDTVNNVGAKYYKYTKAGVYTGISSDLQAQDANSRATKWDGTHFWVCGQLTSKVYQYDSDFNYTGFSFDAVKPNTGIAVLGDTIYVQDGTTEDINMYSKAGVYLGLAGNVANEDTTTRGITFKGDKLHVVGNDTDRVYEYYFGVVTPNLPQETGSPFPYKIVADYTGGN